MNQSPSDYTQNVMDRVAAIHEMYAKQLLAEQGIDIASLDGDPKKLDQLGYRLVHEKNGDENRLMLCKIISERHYGIDIKIEPSDSTKTDTASSDNLQANTGEDITDEQQS